MTKKMTIFIAGCLLTATTVFADVQINETNFPDPNFRAWILEQPFGEDGVITDEEIAEIMLMDVSSQNIADLTGINFFTNLTELRAWGNQLTFLDVSSLTNLTILGVASNHLTSLDVSGLTNLTSLSVWNNQLTSLDVSGLTNLTSLRASNNQLTSLDVSNLTSLRQLFVSDNQFTSLDVSNLPSLTTLWASNNLLTSLDALNLPNNLTSLSVRDNLLTSFDASSLTNNLTSLDVSNNQLTLLDVSNLTNLEWLSAGNNQLTSLDASNLPNNITSLSVAGNLLTSLDVSGLTNLTILSVDGNQLTSLDVSGLTNLTFLSVNSNQFTSLDVSNLPSLTTLWADRNQLTLLDVSGLTNPETLSVAFNQLTSIDVSNLTNLIYLGVAFNQFTSIDLTGLDNLMVFSANGQAPRLTLTGSNNNYNLVIDLNNPTGLRAGLIFENGILTSTSNAITSSPFSVETGHSNPFSRLSGTLILNYETRITTPTENGVTIEWVHVDGVCYWILVIYADAERTQVVARIVIDAQGNIISSTPYSRNGSPMLSYTVTGLASDTQFFYSLTALDDEKEIVRVSLGSFTTLESGVTVNIPEINLNRTPIAFYTITGARLGQKPQSGIFIILYCDGSAERVMR